MGKITTKKRILFSFRGQVTINGQPEGRENGMPDTAETIENLARKLERVRILNDLRECKTLEEFQELTKKYETLCNDDKS